MKFQKVFNIDKWCDWHSSLSDFIDDFYAEFSFNPNILEANEHTFSQFDFLAAEVPGEQEKVSKKDDVTNRVEELSGNEKIVLEEYVYGDVTLVFAVDDALKNKELRLIYDSDPGWDDEKESTIDFVPERDKVKVYV